MTAIKKPILRRPELQTYFETFRPRQVVGTTLNSEDCPLTRYLNATFDITEVAVYLTTMQYKDAEGDEHSRHHAQWVTCFIEGVDDSKDILPLTAGRRITAAKALRVLAGIR